MVELDPSHHIFRHVGGASIDGDFIDPAVFRRKKKENGQLEDALSVNWVEYFQKPRPQEAIPPLLDIFAKKGRRVGPKSQSKFALLNISAAKDAAAKYTTVAIVRDAQEDDPSHTLVKNYDEALNDQVAEQLAKVVIDTYPARP
jgi:hypothetical protein